VRVPLRIETLLDSAIAVEVEELARDVRFTLSISRFVGGGECSRERGGTGTLSCALEDGPDCELLRNEVGREVVVGVRALLLRFCLA
jgi:hypothetical protein